MVVVVGVKGNSGVVSMVEKGSWVVGVEVEKGSRVVGGGDSDKKSRVCVCVL